MNLIGLETPKLDLEQADANSVACAKLSGNKHPSR